MSTDFYASKYALDCWEKEMGSKPVEEVAHGDWSEDYQVDEAHVFALENGKYAVVIERGCSCYSYDDASIEVVDTLSVAMALFNEAYGNK